MTDLARTTSASLFYLIRSLHMVYRSKIAASG